MHDRGCLSRKIDPCFSLKTKLGKILIVPVHSQPLSHINKHRIAGIHCSLKKSFCSMASCLMAPDPPVFHYAKARTAEDILKRYCPRLQTGCRCDDLKGRARLICIIDAGISPHGIQPVLEPHGLRPGRRLFLKALAF